MNIPTETAEVRRLLPNDLKHALDIIENLLTVYPEIGMNIQLEEIRMDFRRMVDYWKKGFKDEGRAKYYKSLVIRTMRLTADIEQRYAIMHDSRLNAEYFRVRNSGKDWSVDNIRKVLELYVGETAVAELLPANKREAKTRQLIKEQYDTLLQIFDYLRTAEQWSEVTAEAMEELFLSPTVDTLSQQTLIAAVILNCLCWFDMRKLLMLMNVYVKSDDEHVRQRALVGWTLCIKSLRTDIEEPDYKETLSRILADERCMEELQELQIQLVYCINAEKDRNEINNNIMPGIIKNSPIQMRGNSIIELGDDPAEDIIDPEASERRMEELEHRLGQMTDMLKQGHDIFYGGFSQMKRFPFFGKMMHWVMPFWQEHPYITENFTKDDIGLFTNLMKFTPFCDSDRYSFMLALQRLMPTMPESVREMVRGGQMRVMGYDQDTPGTQGQPAVIRRSFLQSLYRFIRVYPGRDTFPDVFSEKHEMFKAPAWLFFANPVFGGGAIEDKLPTMAMYLIKQGRKDEARLVMINYQKYAPSYEACMVLARLSADFGAADYYRRALKHRPDDEKAMRGLARASFESGDRTTAFEIYSLLSEKHPDNLKLQLCKAVVMMKMPQTYIEAKDMLYRMAYEHPENVFIHRMLGSLLILLNKPGQAEQVFRKLCAGDGAADEDEVHLGLCLFLQQKFGEAVGILSRHGRESLDMFKDETLTAILLNANNVTTLDYDLLCSMI